MKKLILAGALALALLAAQAFGGTHGNITLGAKAGLNIAKFHGDDVEKAPVVKVESISGFCGGAFAEVPINQTISLQLEVLYTMKGSNETIDGVSGIIDATFAFSYIEIPMLFKAHLPTGAVVRPHLYFGPEVAFRVAATRERKQFGETVEEDIEEGVSATDVGLVFGGGIAFPAMARTFSLEARYDLGLTTTDGDDRVDIKNGVVSVLAGITF